MMNSADGSEAIGGTRRPKRIITNARKEQNRIAQQQYRHRLKDRLQNRESHRHAVSEKRRQILPYPSRGTPEVSKNVAINDAGAATAETQTHSSDDPLFYEDLLRPAFSQSLDPGGMVTGFVTGDESNFDEMASTPFLLEVESDMVLDEDDLQAPYTTVGADEGVSMTGDPISNSFDMLAPNQDPVTMFSHSNMTASMNTIPSISYSPTYDLLEENPTSILQLPLDPLSHCGCCPNNCTSTSLLDQQGIRNTLLATLSSQLPVLQDMISATSTFLYGRQVQTSSRMSPIRLPNPYINLLPCTETTLLAFFHNARCLGFEIREVLHNSPFYRPNTTMADDPQALLAEARKPWIPIHLQPTLPQILIPHHPYLDLLPFPALRDRAITLAASAPQLFQPMDLKRDILRGGLCCDRRCHPLEDRQPWDIRSWQAAPWFLRKWRLLIG